MADESLLEKTIKGLGRFARTASFTVVAGLAALGCGDTYIINGGDGGTDAGTHEMTRVNGIASDGPFQVDSEVSITELDINLEPVNTVQDTTDALGMYSKELPKNTCFITKVTGKDFNEITGQGS
ncbi:MAG: hypothetical protein U9O94_08920, partial [Nanoarchaeota archaeon]|nr:hypothetical protein [Nanoarchaeota archaeon]